MIRAFDSVMASDIHIFLLIVQIFSQFGVLYSTTTNPSCIHIRRGILRLYEPTCAVSSLHQLNIPRSVSRILILHQNLTNLDSIGELCPFLRHVTILTSNIKSLSPTFMDGIPNVYMVNLALNIIHNLPNGIFSNSSSLRELNISHNCISNITSNTFAGAIRLLILDLSFNCLTWLPSNAYRGTPNLCKLYMHNNQLALTDGEAFAGLEFLEYLGLYHNRLTVVPGSTVSNVEELDTLQLDQNNIPTKNEQQSTCLSRFHRLSPHIDIQKFTKMNSSCSLTRVEKLWLIHNDIITITNLAFIRWIGVRKISMSNNMITRIEKLAFYGLHELTKLYLNNNLIKHVSQGAFHEMAGLLTLDLRNNSLGNSPTDILTDIWKTTIESVYIERNSLNTISSPLPFRQIYRRSHSVLVWCSSCKSKMHLC